MQRVAFALAAIIAAAPAAGYGDGQWLFKGGLTTVDPQSDIHDVVDADSAATMNLNATYFLTDSFAFDVLAALPFEHSIFLLDGTRVGDTKQLPPTFSVQFYFNPEGRFRPYLGVGLNYTTFFSESTSGPLSGSDLKLDDSWGLALQAGANWSLTDRWFISFDVRQIDIDSDAWLDGVALGTVEIDPLVYGISIGYAF